MKKNTTIAYLNVVKGFIVKVPVFFKVGQRFRTIREATQQFGLILPPRQGWGYFPGARTLAVWCPNMTDKTKWDNVITSNGAYITERKMPHESAVDFQHRVQNNPSYGADILRLTFGKIGRFYYCLGIYQLEKFDFGKSEAVFKQVDNVQLCYRYRKQIKTTIITEIEESVDFGLFAEL